MSPVPGSYTTVRNVSVSSTTRIPPGISDQVAAALLLKGVTADYLIRDLGHVKKNTRLLVHAAAGGVGQLICAWANSLGALVIGTVSTQEKAKIAREHGCHHVVVSKNYQFSDAVHSICQGADVIIDGLGEEAREENFAALAKCGHWISLGQATGSINEISPHWLVQKSLSFSRPVVFDYVSTQELLDERAQRIWKAYFDGVLKNPAYEEFELQDAYLAHEQLEARLSTGSLLLKIR
jgi:NADPH:quinone reductase-like Zn-dependent oxidoreductase